MHHIPAIGDTHLPVSVAQCGHGNAVYIECGHHDQSKHVYLQGGRMSVYKLSQAQHNLAYIGPKLKAGHGTPQRGAAPCETCCGRQGLLGKGEDDCGIFKSIPPFRLLHLADLTT